MTDSITEEDFEQITVDALTELKNLGVQDAFLVLPFPALPHAMISEYWYQLDKADILKYRFPDQSDVTFEWATDYSCNNSTLYGCVDVLGEIRLEFALDDPPVGRCRQLHVSGRPDTPYRVLQLLAEHVSNMVLENWYDSKTGEPYIEAMFGLPAIGNQRACAFVKSAGFTVMGVLPHAVPSVEKGFDDALITVKQRKGI